MAAQNRNSRPTADLQLFRFGLRQLLGFTTGVSALMAVVALASTATTIMVFLGTTIVAAHVSSTLIGTRLRAHSDAEHDSPSVRSDLFRSETPVQIASRIVTSRSETATSALHGRERSLVWLSALTLLGVALGGGGGTSLLAMAIGDRTSPAGLAVGGISLAIVGGWSMFVIGNFFGVAGYAWRQALAEPEHDETPHDGNNR